MTNLYTEQTPNDMLLRRIEELETALSLLEGEAVVLHPNADITLTAQENKLLFLFAHTRTVTSKQMIATLYPNKAKRTGREKNTCSIFIVRLREKLKRFDIFIFNMRGSCWFVLSDDYVALRKWYGLPNG